MQYLPFVYFFIYEMYTTAQVLKNVLPLFLSSITDNSRMHCPLTVLHHQNHTSGASISFTIIFRLFKVR